MDVKTMMEMRMNGATFQEIADAAGESKQSVHQKITAYVKRLTGIRGHSFDITTIRYKGIYEYFKENVDENVSSFTEKIYGSNGPHTTKLRGFITGEVDSQFTVSQIQRICEVVGKPFEEVFEKRDVMEGE